MNRLIAAAVAMICLSLGTFLLPALSQAPEKAAPPKDAPAAKAREESLALIRMLEQTIETKGLQEPVKLKVALEYFFDQFGGKLPILVDKNAFSAELGPDSEDPYETVVCLPPVPAKMSVDRALRAIITQIGNGNATYVIRRNWIEITTQKRSAVVNSLHHPCIVKSFEQQPLPDVLQDLAYRADVAITLDPNIGKKASTPISATFRNCSLEEALVTVTEMSQLKFVVLERSVFVTTPDKAKVLEKEERIRRKNREYAPHQATKRLEKAAE
jgi:hypothetical protein